MPTILRRFSRPAIENSWIRRSAACGRFSRFLRTRTARQGISPLSFLFTTYAGPYRLSVIVLSPKYALFLYRDRTAEDPGHQGRDRRTYRVLRPFVLGHLP